MPKLLISLAKILKMSALCLLLGGSTISIGLAQTEVQAAEKAKAMGINTRQQAMSELAKRGVSENQARQMARMRGIDFDEFLDNYLAGQSGSQTSGSQTSGSLPPLKSSMQYSDELLEDQMITSVSKNTEISPNEAAVDSLYFGYSIFQNNPFLQKEYLTGNIDEGYLISPGDRLRITIFGDNTLETEVEVDLNGNLNIQGFGMFQAGGNTFQTLRERLKIYFGKYFQGLLSARQSTFLDVSLTQIRPVQVTIMGESNAPGAHLISGMATVLNALYSSGGIKNTGSLRSIKIYRNNKLHKEIDLYSYLTTGALEEDIRLTSNDLIFIPSRLSSVSLDGEVKTAAIYELKPGEGLAELIRFSGGVPVTASVSTVTVQRIKPALDRASGDNYDRYLSSVDYRSLLDAGMNFPLVDGDQVRFYPILARVTNPVTLSGHVNQAGTYPLEDFPDLKSLIEKAGKNLRPNAYLGKVDIFREDAEGNKNFITYNLQSVISQGLQVTLESQDSVKIYSLEEVRGEEMVRVTGFLDQPKTVFWRENLSMYDLIFQATSWEELDYQSQLLTSRIDLKRFDPASGQFKVSVFSLDRMEELQQTILQPKDEVILFSRSVTEVLSPRIKVKGYVPGPGEFALTQGMTVEDAILQAGGFQEYADQETIVVNRERFDYNSGQLSERFEIVLDREYLLGRSGSSATNFSLQHNDILSVRKMEGAEPLRSVSITGAVRYPGAVVLNERFESFSDLAVKVGGLRPDAYLPASYITRADKVLGINLAKAKNLQQSFFQDGDEVYIAVRSGTVEVLGAVENETAFVWREGKRSKYYLNKAGGKLRKEGGKAYVIQANGLSGRVGLLRNPTVFPDSRILVNRNPPKEKSDTSFIESFVRVLSVATGALTTLVLVQNLNR